MELSNIKCQNTVPNFRGTKQIQKIVSKTISESEKRIYGQDMCWKLYKPEVFEEFIKSDKELTDILSDTMDIARAYGLNLSIDMLQKLKKMKPEIAQFYDLVNTKYNINLEIPPKVYRFVGKSEIDALNKDGIVRPQRGYWDKFDVTLNPDLNWNGYRITFKPEQKFSVLDSSSKIKENPGTNHDYFYHYEGPYQIEDIEKIEELDKKIQL